MFDKKVYVQRRELLKNQIKSGLLFFPGNNESPMNYPANGYHFRQDSSFLYFFGLDVPGLAAVIDVDDDRDIVYGYDFTVDDIVWMGPQETMTEKAKRVGASSAEPPEKLKEKLRTALKQGRRIHYLPQYRADTLIQMENVMGLHHSVINDYVSEPLVRAVISQRSIKYSEEVEEIEKALDISYETYRTAMQITEPNMFEYEVSGMVEGVIHAKNSFVSFPVIYSVHGEILHGHYHGNQMKDGRLVVMDSGAESSRYYACDITRTYPVNGTFTPFQKDVYTVVLAAQKIAIDMAKPGVLNRDCHLAAARTIADGMKSLGLMKGNMEDAVKVGAHALFFPHGLGHMLGLDVHDMEGLGENYVGYDQHVKRSDQFGLAYLRLGRKLEPGFVITVEPGIYFIPELIDQWKTSNKFAEFINYDKVDQHREFGGVRIEDDLLIVKEGNRVLGKPIAKTIDEIETWCGK